MLTTIKKDAMEKAIHEFFEKKLELVQYAEGTRIDYDQDEGKTLITPSQATALRSYLDGDLGLEAATEVMASTAICANLWTEANSRVEDMAQLGNFLAFNLLDSQPRILELVWAISRLHTTPTPGEASAVSPDDLNTEIAWAKVWTEMLASLEWILSGATSIDDPDPKALFAWASRILARGWRVGDYMDMLDLCIRAMPEYLERDPPTDVFPPYVAAAAWLFIADRRTALAVARACCGDSGTPPVSSGERTIPKNQVQNSRDRCSVWIERFELYATPEGGIGDPAIRAEAAEAARALRSALQEVVAGG